jgi:transcriptional regulator
MFLPPLFAEARIEVMHDLIRHHPFGTLVTYGENGLNATQIPFFVIPGTGGFGSLKGHLSKGNPHWREMETCSECLVIFQGPHGYVSPSWYPSKTATHEVVPTWNYATVHAWGRPVITQDAQIKRDLVSGLTDHLESSRAAPWQVTDAPDNFIQKQLNGIVGLEISVTRMEGKWKMSQNRNPEDHAGVLSGLVNTDDPHANPVLAQEMLKSTKNNHVERSLPILIRKIDKQK